MSAARQRKWCILESPWHACDNEYEPIAPTGYLPIFTVPDEVIARYFRARSAWIEANAALEGIIKDAERGL